MIENVEEFAAELKIEFFGDLGVLGNGEIGIEEVGADNGVAAQVSGVTGAGDDGIGTSTGLSGCAVECARHGKGCVRRRGAIRDGGLRSGRRSVERLTQNCVGKVLCWVAGATDRTQEIRTHGKGNPRTRTDGEGWITRFPPFESWLRSPRCDTSR